jgi:hypothetical protein
MEQLAVILFIISGSLVALIALSLLAKWTGVGEMLGNILSFFGSFFNAIFQSMHAVVNAAPGFVKVIFFVLLFVFFGTILYSFTVGLTHSCVTGDVYKVDFLTGVGSVFIPKAAERQLEPFRDLPKSFKDGFVQTDSGGQPSIVVPKMYAEHVWNKLDPDSTTTGFSEFKWFINGGDLRFYVCRTTEGACYLRDVKDLASVIWGPDRFWDSDCAIRDEGEVKIADGTKMFEVSIQYDSSKAVQENGGLFYQLQSVSGDLSGKTYDFSSCKPDNTWNLESLAPVLYVDFSKPDRDGNSYGSGNIYNAMKVQLGLTTRGTDSTLMKEQVAVAVSGEDDDIDVRFIKSKAMNYNNFMQKYGNKTKYKDDDMISFTCEDKKTNDETFRFFGLPILSLEFVAFIAIATLIFFVIGMFRNR